MFHLETFCESNPFFSVASKGFLEELPGMRPRFCHFFRRPGANYRSPICATTGAKIDDPVRGLYHVQIVFDNDHSVAPIYQPVQNV